MRTILNLFARSPFVPLQQHMSLVMDCTIKVKKLIEYFLKQDYEQIPKMEKEIAELEKAADLTKNEIRNNLPKGLFLPIDRNNLLQILSIQDDIADKCEDIGNLLCLRSFSLPKGMNKSFTKFLNINFESIEEVHKIILKLDELLEVGFSGVEAETVKAMINYTGYLEHEADKLQHKLLTTLFENDKHLSYSTFMLIERTIGSLGKLSDFAEKLANRVHMTLEFK
jgi:uncharacterized protein